MGAGNFWAPSCSHSQNSKTPQGRGSEAAHGGVAQPPGMGIPQAARIPVWLPQNPFPCPKDDRGLSVSPLRPLPAPGSSQDIIIGFCRSFFCRIPREKKKKKKQRAPSPAGVFYCHPRRLLPKIPAAKTRQLWGLLWPRGCALVVPGVIPGSELSSGISAAFFLTATRTKSTRRIGIFFSPPRVIFGGCSNSGRRICRAGPSRAPMDGIPELVGDPTAALWEFSPLALGLEPPQKEPLGWGSPWIHQSRDCRAGEALPHPIKSMRGSIQEFPESGSGVKPRHGRLVQPGM